MSFIVAQIEKSKGLLSALDALTNKRAFLTLFATLVGSGLAASIVGYLGAQLVYGGHFNLASIFGTIGTALVFVLALSGFSATGFLLNAQMLGRAQPTIMGAWMSALVTLPRLLGVLLLLALTLLALILVVLLLLVICKIPGLGEFLFALVYPVSAMVLGVALYSGIYISALAGPAIWNGHALFASVTTLIAIARQRLLVVIVQTLLLGILAAIVAGIIYGAVFMGMGMTSALSLPVLHAAAGFNPMEIMNLFGGRGGGYMAASMFGSAILIFAASVLPMLVLIAGYCLIFNSVAVGLDVAAIESQINKAKDAANKKLQEAREQAAAQMASMNTSATSQASCPSCQQVTAPDDVFCGNCGHKLK